MPNSDARTDLLDPLIGRAPELERLSELVGEHRLVTITGPGGTGKTRLARSVLDRWREGKVGWFVDLSATTDRDQIPQAIATIVATEDPGTEPPIDLIVRILADQEALLVLDNLEQLPGAAEPIEDLLRAAPSVVVLGTSRLPLGTLGERQMELAPLDLPRTGNPGAVVGSPAGALFLARARALGRLEELDEQTALDVIELVRRLDGLPLAIELAAARTRALSPREIITRLDQRGLAGVGSAPGNESRSLLAVLDWTLSMLSPEGMAVIQAGSICAGFDLALIETILPNHDGLAGVESLLMLGLLNREPNALGESRFRLLEVVRAEVRRRLDAQAVEAIQGRLTEELSTRAAIWYDSPSTDWREHLLRSDSDASNYLMALDHLERVDIEAALMLWHHLERFWMARGRLGEGKARFERLRAKATQPSVGLARALSTMTVMEAMTIGPRLARGWLEEALRVAEAVQDRWSAFRNLEGLILVAASDDDRETASFALGRLDALGDRPDDEPYLRLGARHSRALAIGVIHGEESDEVVRAFRDVRDQLGDEATNPTLAWSTAANLSEIHAYRGEFELAAENARRAIAGSTAMEDDRSIGFAYNLLAAATAELGKVDEAIEALRASQRHGLETAEIEWLIEHLTKAMPVALMAGLPLVAARAWGVVSRLIETGQGGLTGPDQRRVQSVLKRVRAAAPSLQVELAIREGQDLDALPFIRELPEILSDGARRSAIGATGRRPTAGRHSELTKREVEILRLVGLGRSDSEIGEALFISPKTASVHVANVKGKLGASSRLEIALKARELGLVEGLPPT